MSGHTPGRWSFGHIGTDGLWVGPSHDQKPVAIVPHDCDQARDESRANARLIAAAPELLEAADDMLETQAALDNRELMGPNAEDYFVLLRRRNAARERLESVIAKATGEAS